MFQVSHCFDFDSSMVAFVLNLWLRVHNPLILGYNVDNFCEELNDLSSKDITKTLLL